MARERERRPRNAGEADRELASLQAGGTSTRRPSVLAPPGARPMIRFLRVRDGIASALASPSESPAAPLRVPRRCRLPVRPLRPPRGTPRSTGARRRSSPRASASRPRPRTQRGEGGHRLRGPLPPAGRADSDEGARPAFLRGSCRRLRRLVRPGPEAGPEAGDECPEAGIPAVGPLAPGHATFLPALLAAAEQRLAAEIGPLARVLVKREAKRHPAWTASSKRSRRRSPTRRDAGASGKRSRRSGLTRRRTAPDWRNDSPVVHRRAATAPEQGLRMPTLSTRKFIALRKLTRALAETLRTDLRGR